MMLVDIGIVAILLGMGVVIYISYRTHQTVRAVDHAVNQKLAGQSTISEQVQRMADEVPAQRKAAQKVIDDAAENQEGGTP